MGQGSITNHTFFQGTAGKLCISCPKYSGCIKKTQTGDQIYLNGGKEQAHSIEMGINVSRSS